MRARSTVTRTWLIASAAAMLAVRCSSPTTAAELARGADAAGPTREAEAHQGEGSKPDATTSALEFPAGTTLEERMEAYLAKHKPGTVQKKIVVRKSRRLLEVWINDTRLVAYKADLGGNPVPDKVQRGDSATPEGEFFIARKLPRSTFYKALLISYPDRGDAERGLETGLISRKQRDAIVRAIARCVEPPQGTRLGGAVEIHGNGGYGEDWTLGCVGIADEAMLGLFNWAEVGCKKVKDKLVPKTLVVIEP